jgi:hypothetical protein
VGSCLLMDRIDQLKCPLYEASGVTVRLHPDGEKYRANIAHSSRFEVEVTAVEWTGQVIILIQQPLWSVGVRVYDEGGIVYFTGDFHMRLPDFSGLPGGGQHESMDRAQPMGRQSHLFRKEVRCMQWNH